MDGETFDKKQLIILFFVGILITFVLFLLNKADRRTRLTSCRLKSGHALYLRLQNRHDFIFTTGQLKDPQLLTCLGKTLPYYDRSIEAVVFLGFPGETEEELNFLNDRYRIKNVYIYSDYYDDKIVFNNDSIYKLFLVNPGDRVEVSKYATVQFNGYTITKKSIDVHNLFIKVTWPNHELHVLTNLDQRTIEEDLSVTKNVERQLIYIFGRLSNQNLLSALLERRPEKVYAPLSVSYATTDENIINLHKYESVSWVEE